MGQPRNHMKWAAFYSMTINQIQTRKFQVDLVSWIQSIAPPDLEEDRVSGCATKKKKKRFSFTQIFDILCCGNVFSLVRPELFRKGIQAIYSQNMFPSQIDFPNLKHSVSAWKYMMISFSSSFRVINKFAFCQQNGLTDL